MEVSALAKGIVERYAGLLRVWPKGVGHAVSSSAN